MTLIIFLLLFRYYTQTFFVQFLQKILKNRHSGNRLANGKDRKKEKIYYSCQITDSYLALFRFNFEIAYIFVKNIYC